MKLVTQLLYLVTATTAVNSLQVKPKSPILVTAHAKQMSRRIVLGAFATAALQRPADAVPPRGAIDQQGVAARRNPTDQWGGSKLGTKEPVKQSAMCRSGLYTNVAQGKCTDVGDITKMAGAKELDSQQDAVSDKLAARLSLGITSSNI